MLLLLLAAVDTSAPERDSCSRCVVAFFSCSGFFFLNQPEFPLEFYEISIEQRDSVGSRDSIGGWLHHRRCVAVRSDAWVMVMLLHLGCIQRNEWSPNFRSLIFYIMYHFVRNYKERFGIHVNTQTVVTFFDIGTCTTCLRMHHATCYVSFIPYVDTTTAATV